MINDHIIIPFLHILAWIDVIFFGSNPLENCGILIPLLVTLSVRFISFFMSDVYYIGILLP